MRRTKKRHVRPFLLNVVGVRCPDCNEETPLKIGSMLGTLKTSALVLEPELIRDIFTMFVRNWSIDHPEEQWGRDSRQRLQKRVIKKTGVPCARCSRVKPLLYWVVVEHDKIIGPLCMRCLRYQVWKDIEGEVGLSTDLAVLVLPATQKTLDRVRNASHPSKPDRALPSKPSATKNLLF
jgi:hypothetical protein